MNRQPLQSIVTTSVLFALLLLAGLPLIEAATQNLTYDANGNLVTGDGKYRVYNSQNRLQRLYDGNSTSGTLLQEYVFHPVEERILSKKTYWPNGTLQETVYYVNDDFNQVKNSSGRYNTTYYFHDGKQLAQKLPSGAVEYLLGDHEGSASIATNSTGSVIERTTYTPYGAVLTGGNKTRYDYEGREADAVSGDTDFRFRKYRSEWGLFTQPDDLQIGMFSPQHLSRYSFEGNSPYGQLDPTGHWAAGIGGSWTGIWLVGSAGGGGALVVSYDKTQGFQAGLMEGGQVTGALGVGGDFSVDLSFSPDAKSIGDLSGPGITGGASISPGWSLGYDYAESASAPVSMHTLHVGAGASAEIHSGATYTFVQQLYSRNPVLSVEADEEGEEDGDELNAGTKRQYAQTIQPVMGAPTYDYGGRGGAMNSPQSNGGGTRGSWTGGTPAPNGQKPNLHNDGCGGYYCT